MTPSSDLRSYTITIKNNVLGDNRVNITYLPEPQQCHISLPKQVNSGDTLLCSKQANQTTIVVMNTDKGGIAHVEVPGTDAVVTGMLTELRSLRSTVNDLERKADGSSVAKPTGGSIPPGGRIFGGIYSVVDNACSDVHANRTYNAISGQLSCTDGFTPYAIGRFRAGDEECGATQFVCLSNY